MLERKSATLPWGSVWGFSAAPSSRRVIHVPLLEALSRAASSVVPSQRTIAARGGTTAVIGAGGSLLATTTTIDLSAATDCIGKEYHCENKNCDAGDCPILGQCNDGPRRGSR
ncbi:hypothetical protein AGR1A_pAt20540 [Agrobacterium fabacearum CFBP 5771]|nr:hypothetical protein AGR1A_pAt20540 [Agrobacterium fabacearum CFBP 5771]